MIRYVSLCLALCTVACGSSNSSDSDISGYNPKKTIVSTDSLETNGTASESRTVQSNSDYPIGPDATLTPGVRCAHADEIRYPEKIAYCTRSVSSGTKRAVISQYDDQLGYHIESMSRNLFKIDHYIPLCMGGDNAKTNLWPQHKEVYSLTDPLEEALCVVLARGKITQDESIEKMLYAKAHLDETGEMLKKVKELY